MKLGEEDRIFLHLYTILKLYIMTDKVLFIFKFFILRVTYSKYCNDIIMEINLFHTTECQFYPFQHTNPCDSAFCFIDFKTRKKK